MGRQPYFGFSKSGALLLPLFFGLNQLIFPPKQVTGTFSLNLPLFGFAPLIKACSSFLTLRATLDEDPPSSIELILENGKRPIHHDKWQIKVFENPSFVPLIHTLDHILKDGKAGQKRQEERKTFQSHHQFITQDNIFEKILHFVVMNNLKVKIPPL